ncbi:MAG: phosphoserine phosphatase SerB [Pseudomonadota bacterium]|nr:phosphoserine phosphatase SerB [Pseudomonadota bacterium]
MFIATLIAADRLARGDISAAADALRAAGVEPRAPEWIEPDSACDLAFAERAEDAQAALDGLIPGADWVVQPARHRRKKLLAADMDSTMINVECIDELADYAGVKEQVAEITERAMHGELDFAGALRERVLLLQGLEEQVIDHCLAERIRPNPGAVTLVQTMKARGAETILVSGGFTAFVEPIAKRIGFDRYEANVLGVRGGKLSGLTEGSIVDSRRKHDVLSEARKRLGLSPDETLAIGDGANDIPMVEEAGLGIAYRAKPALAAVADARLDHHGLDALLWAQGIPRREWIEV